MVVVPYGVEQVIYEGKVVHLLNDEEMEFARKNNTVDYMHNIDLPETEYKPDGIWRLFHDCTERSYYANWYCSKL